MGNYSLEWELQHSYFLKDCLYEEIDYELKESRVIIYKILDNGISERITLDELIFYIHSVVAAMNYPHGQQLNAFAAFRQLFNKVDAIKKAVENMKIILKYDDEFDETDEEDNKSLAF